MCRVISGFINPKTFDIKVYDISSHHLTKEHFGLDDSEKPDKWREFHYLDYERVECRVLGIDSHSSDECESKVREKFPTFRDFLRFCVVEKGCVCSEDFNLGHVTSAEGLKLPEGVKVVYFYSLTSAKGLKLPEGVEIVDLRSLTSAEGLNLPEGVKHVWCDSLTSAEGLEIPEGVELVNLSSLTLAEGLEIPRGCYIYAPNCIVMEFMGHTRIF